eukprot:scaffold11781_cov96-Isochrysis_galbana.AAC.6
MPAALLHSRSRALLHKLRQTEPRFRQSRAEIRPTGARDRQLGGRFRPTGAGIRETRIRQGHAVPAGRGGDRAGPESFRRSKRGEQSHGSRPPLPARSSHPFSFARLQGGGLTVAPATKTQSRRIGSSEHFEGAAERRTQNSHALSRPTAGIGGGRGGGGSASVGGDSSGCCITGGGGGIGGVGCAPSHSHARSQSLLRHRRRRHTTANTAATTAPSPVRFPPNSRPLTPCAGTFSPARAARHACSLSDVSWHVLRRWRAGPNRAQLSQQLLHRRVEKKAARRPRAQCCEECL